MSERADVDALAGVLRQHLPKDRYGDDGESVGTYCTGCDWAGDYFAEGDAGSFDDHLAAAVFASRWLAAHDERVRAEERERLAGVLRAASEDETTWPRLVLGYQAAAGIVRAPVRKGQQHEHDRG